MGCRGYNGSISHVIRDVTGRDDLYLLNNSGNSYDIFSKHEMRRFVKESLDNAEEEDMYLQWYHCHIQ